MMKFTQTLMSYINIVNSDAEEPSISSGFSQDKNGPSPMLVRISFSFKSVALSLKYDEHTVQSAALPTRLYSRTPLIRFVSESTWNQNPSTYTRCSVQMRAFSIVQTTSLSVIHSFVGGYHGSGYHGIFSDPLLSIHAQLSIQWFLLFFPITFIDATERYSDCVYDPPKKNCSSVRLF